MWKTDSFYGEIWEFLVKFDNIWWILRIWWRKKLHSVVNLEVKSDSFYKKNIFFQDLLHSE